jgi:hypothetical protein
MKSNISPNGAGERRVNLRSRLDATSLRLYTEILQELYTDHW